MSETGFRDLFVELSSSVFNALQGIGEAAVRDAMPKAVPAPQWEMLASDWERLLANHFEDSTLTVARSPLHRGFEISHRCKVCGRRHRDVINEEMLMSVSHRRDEYAELMFSSIERLLEQPCKLELAKP